MELISIICITVGVILAVLIIIYISIFASLKNKKNLVQSYYNSINLQLANKLTELQHLIRLLNEKKIALPIEYREKINSIKIEEVNKIKETDILQVKYFFQIVQNQINKSIDKMELMNEESFCLVLKEIEETDYQLRKSIKSYNKIANSYNDLVSLFLFKWLARLLKFNKVKVIDD